MIWQDVEFESLYLEPSRNGVYKSKEHHGAGAKIVNMGELFRYEFVGGQDMARLEMTNEELARSGLFDGDLLFGRRSLVEAGAGKCSIVRGIVEPTTFESSLIRVRPNPQKASSAFLYYWFRSPLGRGRIRAIVSGTNVKGIRGSDLRSVLVALPNMEVQVRIATILSAYDDLIENNRRRIALLEEAARQLYKEWFVRFHFPGHEHVKIIDGVPEGWERLPLGEVLTLQRGFDLPVSARNEGTVRVYGSTGIVGFHDAAKVNAPMLITGRSGSLGQVCLVSVPCWPLNTALWVREFKRASPWFAYFLLSEMGLEKFNGGASVPTLDRKVAHAALVVLPSVQLLETFDETAQQSFELIDNLTKQNEQLSKARDLLLPKLMSGAIAA